MLGALAAALWLVPAAGRGDAPGDAGAGEFPAFPGASDSEGAPQDQKAAAAAYRRGVGLAVRKRDYAAALRAFQKAHSQASSSATLFAVAECRRVMNRSVDALFTFANALYEDNRLPPERRMDPRFVQTAKRNLDELLARLAEVRVRLPEGARLSTLTLNGVPVMSTNLFGQAPRDILIAGGRRRGPLRPAAYADRFSFYTRPGIYDLEFTLADGRRLAMDRERLTPKGRDIDLGSAAIPAKLVVENIQPGMRVVVTRADAETLVDREFSKPQRLALGDLEGGAYDLMVSRSGFRDFSATYRLSAGQRERVALDLRPKPLIRSWKLWLGVGLVAAAGIVTTAVVLSTRDKEAPPKSGTGVVTIGIF